MVGDLIFTDDEIRSQLEAIGFEDMSDAQLRLFRQDLERLIQEEANVRLRHDAVEMTDNDPPWSVPFRHLDRNDSSSSKKSIIKIEKVYWDPAKNHELTVDAKSTHDDATGLTTSGTGDVLITISQNSQATESLSSTSSSRPRKRKVLRHKNSKTFICDESASLSGDLDHVVVSCDQRHLAIGRQWNSTGDLVDALPTLRRTKSTTSTGSQKSIAKSLKTDPVALYHYYMREWERHKAPGEKDHSELRWNIRKMMMAARRAT